MKKYIIFTIILLFSGCTQNTQPPSTEIENQPSQKEITSTTTTPDIVVKTSTTPKQEETPINIIKKTPEPTPPSEPKIQPMIETTPEQKPAPTPQPKTEPADEKITEPEPIPEPVITPTPNTNYEATLLSLINEYRKENGLTALTSDAKLNTLAIEHSAYMSGKQSLSHDNFDTRFKQSGKSTCAENVGWNYATPEGMFTGWKNSPGHNKNMLNKKMTSAGLAVSDDLYITLFLCGS